MNSMPPSMDQKQPVLPAIMGKPLAIMPAWVHSSLIVKVLNIMLHRPLQEGELDFLQNNGVSVEVSDLGLKFALTWYQRRLVGRVWRHDDNLNLAGSLYDFLLLAHRQEDSDTLFFQRRLRMVGDTELGLAVKNLLDGMDTDTVRGFKQMDFLVHHGIKTLERFFQ